MDKISPPQDDDDAHSVLSHLTGSTDNDTDTLGRRILQHQRDAHRINELVHHHGQAFRKARPMRNALTLDNLERNSIAIQDQGQARRAPSLGGSSSNGSDPPLNVPREWGRKGRQNTGWMRRIHQDDAVVAQRHTVAVVKHESSHVDWAEAAEHPSPSAGHATPPSQRQQRLASTPPSSHSHHLPLDRVHAWDVDQDLTAASLLASTPALPSRSRAAIDEIRQREIQVIEQRALTTSTRQIWEQTPSETRRRRSRDGAHKVAHQHPPAASQPSSAPERRHFPRRSSVLANKENIPIATGAERRNPPLLLNKSVESIGAVDQGNQATANLNTATQRPQQKRTDSMALLRRLARVSSSSPSPTQAKEAVDAETARMHGSTQTDKYQVHSDASAPPAAASTNSNRIAHGDREPISSQPQPSQSQAVTDVDGIPQRPTTAPQPGEATQKHQTNITQRGTSTFALQTPVVTGAWVDTPRATTGDSATDDIRTALDKLAADSIIPRPRSAPPLPASALDAVLHDMRARTAQTDDEPTLGDSTIASLEDILNPSSNDPTIAIDIPDAALLDASLADAWADAHSEPVDTVLTTQSERDRRQELLAIESMNKHLRSARTSLKDTSKALSKMEHRVDAATMSPSKPPRDSVKDEPRPHLHAADRVCGSCGRRTSVFRALMDEYLALYYRRERTSRWWGIRLTWLGVACLAFWIWLASETTLCSIYCHPTYAYKMRGYGVDPTAPRFPYVVPTLLFRPFAPLWRPVLAALAWCFGVLFPSSSFSSSSSSAFAASRSSSSAAGSRSAAGRATGFLKRAGSARSADEERVSWFKSSRVGKAWSQHRGDEGDAAGAGAGAGAGSPLGSVRRMDGWSRGYNAWEYGERDDAESMLEDEVVV
ncbi:hypothetical protein MBLNU459_g0590t1 [Dothideomycetes sp. NU459]